MNSRLRTGMLGEDLLKEDDFGDRVDAEADEIVTRMLKFNLQNPEIAIRAVNRRIRELEGNNSVEVEEIEAYRSAVAKLTQMIKPE